MSKIAVITGAGSGIGRATAHAFLDAGFSVALLGRREEPLIETAKGHANARAYPCDITDEASVDATFAAIAKDFGRIDVLFNNAGTNVPPGTIDEISLDQWNTVIGANLTGSFLCARAAFRHMRGQDPQGGRIINNGSISAQAPRPGSVPYTTSKHAITGLTKTLALDGRPFGIAAGQVDIGNALTEMARKMTEGVQQADGSIAIEAVMDPADVAKTVLSMASLGPDANILFTTVMATNMPLVGRG